MRLFLAKVYGFKFLDGFMLIYPVYGVMFVEHGLTPQQVTATLMAWSVIVFATQIPAGILADRYSRRWILFIAQLLRGLGFLIWLLFPGFIGYLIGFLLWGLKSAFTNGIFEALVYDELVHRDRREDYVRVSGRSQVALAAAILLSAVGASVFVRFGYEALIWASIASAVAGSFSAILLPPAHLTIAVSQPDPVGQLKAGFGYALKHAALPSIIALLAMNQAFGGAMDGMWPIFGLQAGLPRDQTALLVGGISIAQAIGAAMAHRLRAHQPVLFQLFFALIGLLLVTGASIFQPWTVGLIMVICGLFKVVEVNFDGRLHHSIPSEMRATIASVKTFASQIVMTAVLPIFGQLAGATSYRVAFFTCGLVIMATGLSFALLDRRRMASGS